MIEGDSGGVGWFEPKEPSDLQPISLGFINEPTTNGEEIMNEPQVDERREKIERDQRRGAAMVLTLCFITGFFTQRYMRRKQLLQLDFLTEDKIIASFAKGRPLVLSRIDK